MFFHSYSNSSDGPSGFGFELTFRIRRDPSEINPPTWPAHLLQSLARYVFYSQAQLMPGDHIPWPTALDKKPNTENEKQNIGSKSEDFERNKKYVAMTAAATAASILAANNTKIQDSSISALLDPSIYASMVAAALDAVNLHNQNARGNQSKDNEESDSQSSRICHMLLVNDPQLKMITTSYGYIKFLQVTMIAMI